jgi:uncharacterized protein with NRDE domain
MCLIVAACGMRADAPLLLAANRDEFFARPTEPARFWPEAPSILAGRDLEQGGTWLGMTRTGRIAAVTNFRDGTHQRTSRHSRGWLVRDFLLSDLSAEAFLESVHAARSQYDGFNLIVGTGARLYYYSNRSAQLTALGAGVHGLSNHLLNTPWPKVERAKAQMAALTHVPPAGLNDGMFALLSDDAQAPDDALPATGISLEWERLLSSAFIRSPGYGTRCSTTLLINAAGEVRFEERTFSPEHTLATQRVETFSLPAAAVQSVPD